MLTMINNHIIGEKHAAIFSKCGLAPGLPSTFWPCVELTVPGPEQCLYPFPCQSRQSPEPQLDPGPWKKNRHTNKKRIAQSAVHGKTKSSHQNPIHPVKKLISLQLVIPLEVF